MGRPVGSKNKKIVDETTMPALLAKFAVVQEQVTIAECKLSDSLAELEMIQAELLTRFNLDVREVNREPRERPDYGSLNKAPEEVEQVPVPTHAAAPVIIHPMATSDVDRIRADAGMLGDPDKELQGDDLNKAASGVLNRLQRSLKP